MALDHDGLFAVIGKFVKTINTVNGYISALNSAEGEIYTILNTEALQRYYADPVNIPAQFDSFQSQVTQWTSALITDVSNILVDRAYVIDQLNLRSFSTTDVLNALYDYMILNSESLKSSVVSLGGSDVDKAIYCQGTLAETHGVTGQDPLYPALMVSRLLDGVNSPGNNVTAHLRYDGIESQLARSCTVYAELLTNEINNESAQLYSGISAVEPYQILSEDPGVGPIIQTPESNNLLDNFDFSEWTATNVPAAWSMSGTIATDYSDISGNGSGPLKLSTEGTTASQKLEGLAYNTAYGIAVHWGVLTSGGTGDNIIGVRLKTQAGATLVSQVTEPIDVDGDTVTDGIIYLFFSLDETVNLTDVYLEIEFKTELDTSSVISVKKAVVAPINYWNGLGWMWWPTHNLAIDKSYVPIGNKTSMAVSNNNGGVFQTFFRKAFAVQLPTVDSPGNTIDEAFAT